MTLLDERPSAHGSGAGGAMIAASGARRAMIDSQLRVNGVNEPAILAAFAAIAREDFVPADLRSSAYIDRAIALGGGQFLPAPLVHGRMLSEALPAAGQQVLVVSANGYLAALVTAMGAAPTVLAPADAASTRSKGEPAQLILIDGAIEQLPAALAARLAEGGRIVTGLAERGVTRLAAGRKTAGEVTLLPLAELGMPVLAAFAAPQRWSF